jgi:hypothetical protein
VKAVFYGSSGGAAGGGLKEEPFSELVRTGTKTFELSASFISFESRDTQTVFLGLSNSCRLHSQGFFHRSSLAFTRLS